MSRKQGTNLLKVSILSETFYAHWRVQSGAVVHLRDELDSPPEKLLQAIWQHQRLCRDALRTVDGQVVRVLHPGFRNLEGGPDFRAAVVQIGEEAARSGDVEVDLRASGWHAHGHDRNPAFRNVVLHVIWESENPMPSAPPLVPLRPVLDAPLGELSLWLGGETAQSFPEQLRGECCAPLRSLSSEQLRELLRQAAGVRLRSKAAQFQARARQAGWEQALWEGLFRALGYKHNVWPMQRLAELRPLWATEAGPGQNKTLGEADEIRVTSQGRVRRDTPLTMTVQARLLGISGLLPIELTPAQVRNDGYLRAVWDLWWRERDGLAEHILPRIAWHLHGLRPANHPQRRLALGGSWVLAGHIPARLQEWCAADLPEGELAAALLEELQAPPDEFWSWHWTLNSARLTREQPLLGATRVTDLAVNVVLPWLWARAEEGRSEPVQRRIEERYFEWPAAQDNSVLRLARQRLLGGASGRVLPGAAYQQGLLQILRDFCDHSNSLCEACKLPETVRRFRGGTA